MRKYRWGKWWCQNCMLINQYFFSIQIKIQKQPLHTNYNANYNINKQTKQTKQTNQIKERRRKEKIITRVAPCRLRWCGPKLARAAWPPRDRTGRTCAQWATTIILQEKCNFSWWKIFLCSGTKEWWYEKKIKRVGLLSFSGTRESVLTPITTQK